VVGDVGVVEVEPEAELLGELVPLLGIEKDALEAAPHEGLDPILEDRVPPRDAKLLLHLDLDRKPVGVPAALARDVVAPHRLVARDHVFHHARQSMAIVRKAVGRGRPLVEDETRPIRPPLEALPKDVGLAPELPDAGLGRREVHDGGNLFEDGLGHGAHRLRPPGAGGNASR